MLGIRHTDTSDTHEPMDEYPKESLTGADARRELPTEYYRQPEFFVAFYAWLSSSHMAARHFRLAEEDVKAFERHLFGGELPREPTEEERRLCVAEAERRGFGPEHLLHDDIVDSLVEREVQRPPFEATFELSDDTRWKTVFEEASVTHLLEHRDVTLPMGCLGPHPIVPVLRWDELFSLSDRVESAAAFTFLLTPCCADASMSKERVSTRVKGACASRLLEADVDKVVEFMVEGELDVLERRRLEELGEELELGPDALKPPEGRIRCAWSHDPELGWVADAPNCYRNPESEHASRWREADGYSLFQMIAGGAGR